MHVQSSIFWASLVAQLVKNEGDMGSIPRLGRSPAQGKGYPLQYSGLENSMDCIVHVVQRLRHYRVTFTVSLCSQFHIFIKLLKFCKFCFVLRNLYESKLRRSFQYYDQEQKNAQTHPSTRLYPNVLCAMSLRQCLTFSYSVDCGLTGSTQE